MIKTVLIIVGIAIVIGMIILWFIAGGAGAVIRSARSVPNPITALFGQSGPGASIRLPFQPAQITQGPDIAGYLTKSGQDINGDQDTTDQTQAIDSSSQIFQYGTPSPYAGKVHMSLGGVYESNPSDEYVELLASPGLQGQVVISGWSLLSAVTGARAYIPEAAPVFFMGVVNTVAPTALTANESAIVTTAASPFGVSFRENQCTGYLNQVKQFTPDISDECPSPSDALPETADNLKTYGPSCFDYVGSLPHCYFPGSQIPNDLSSNCRSFVANTYSYNGCVNRYSTQGSFTFPTWRLFLNHTSELWNNAHDVIRLMDAQGRTVDVLTY
jgi:hypothetical protein